MKIGLVGLGRMGAAMSLRLREQGFDVIGWDQFVPANEALAKTGLPIAANPRAVAADIRHRHLDHHRGSRRAPDL